MYQELFLSGFPPRVQTSPGEGAFQGIFPNPSPGTGFQDLLNRLPREEFSRPPAQAQAQAQTPAPAQAPAAAQAQAQTPASVQGPAQGQTSATSQAPAEAPGAPSPGERPEKPGKPRGELQREGALKEATGEAPSKEGETKPTPNLSGGELLGAAKTGEIPAPHALEKPPGTLGKKGTPGISGTETPGKLRGKGGYALFTPWDESLSAGKDAPSPDPEGLIPLAAESPTVRGEAPAAEEGASGQIPEGDAPAPAVQELALSLTGRPDQKALKNSPVPGDKPEGFGEKAPAEKAGEPEDRGPVIVIEDRRTLRAKTPQDRGDKAGENRASFTGGDPGPAAGGKSPSPEAGEGLLRAPGPGKTGEAGTPAPRSETGELSRLFRDEGIPLIVKQSGIILRDHGQGEIRLVLKPEFLGRVRIRLNLDENHIVGRILVENRNVEDMLKDNLADLVRAFQEQGFGSARLEVAVEEGGQDRSDLSSSGDNQEGAFDGPAPGSSAPGNRFWGPYDSRDRVINLLA